MTTNVQRSSKFPQGGGAAYQQRLKDLFENKHLEVAGEIAKLPQVKMNNRDVLPCASGLYFLLDLEGNIVYLGKTFCEGGFRFRWKNHLMVDRNKPIENYSIAYLELKTSSTLIKNLVTMENALIWALAPRQNYIIAKTIEADFNKVFQRESPSLQHVHQLAHCTRNHAGSRSYADQRAHRLISRTNSQMG
jgi:hypothetical protein